MAKATKWTDEKLKSLKLGDTERERRQLVAPGLYIYVRRRAAGDLAKQWQYRAQVNGARKWLSLGAFPAVGLAKAHADMVQHHAAHEAAKKGEADHPVLAARFARKAAKSLPSVAEAFEEWIADKRLGSARTGGKPVRARTIEILEQNFDADIRPSIGDAKFAKLTRDAMQRCIDAPRKRQAPGAAAHVYRTLRGLTNFAIKRGYIDGADPMLGIENPRPYKPAQTVNAASDAELLALLRALDGSRLHDSTKLAIEFQLLTGARPGEVRLATWHEVSMERSVWTIPAERTKTGRPHQVYLSLAAKQLLERAQGLSCGGEFLFPGSNRQRDGNEAIESPIGPLEKMAVARALSRIADRTVEAGGLKLRPHDLRRTFRTMLSRIGVAPHVAELCLGHMEKETMRRVYDGHNYSADTSEAWQRAGTHITGLRLGIVAAKLQKVGGVG